MEPWGRAICAFRHIHPRGGQEGDTDLELRKLCYGSGVAYIPGAPVEPMQVRGKRRDRMRLLARRTRRGANWRGECRLDDRAAAVGVNLKEASHGGRGREYAHERKTVTA